MRKLLPNSMDFIWLCCMQVRISFSKMAPVMGVLLIFSTLFYSTQVEAQTCPPNVTRYTVTDAVPDPNVNVSTATLGVWMNGVFCDGGQTIWSFNPGTYLDVFIDGTGAHLHGTATVVSEPCGLYNGTIWDVNFYLSNPEEWMSIEPHKELFTGNQPASVTDNWVYFVIESTSTLSLGSEVITMTHYPTTYQYAFQMGWTANGKNLDYGFSAWFEYNFNGRTGNGDIVGVLDSLCEGINPNVPQCQLHTQTMGGWGTSASGNNPGTYRDANFSKAFPKGITIGCNITLKLTSSAAVQAFLPSSGTPSALPKKMQNPGQSYQNTFAGQLVAAKLNVGFDAWDADFGSGTTLLGDAYITSGLFTGYTVNQVIALADQKIGGCNNISFTFSQLSDALAAINENYVDGTENHGFLSCTPPANKNSIQNVDFQSWSIDEYNSIIAYPNPLSSNSQIEITVDKAQHVQVQLYNTNGAFVKEIFQGNLDNDKIHRFNFDGSQLNNGIYFLRMVSNEEVLNVKLVITK